MYSLESLLQHLVFTRYKFWCLLIYLENIPLPNHLPLLNQFYDRISTGFSVSSFSKLISLTAAHPFNRFYSIFEFSCFHDAHLFFTFRCTFDQQFSKQWPQSLILWRHTPTHRLLLPAWYSVQAMAGGWILSYQLLRRP